MKIINLPKTGYLESGIKLPMNKWEYFNRGFAIPRCKYIILQKGEYFILNMNDDDKIYHISAWYNKFSSRKPNNAKLYVNDILPDERNIVNHYYKFEHMLLKSDFPDSMVYVYYDDFLISNMDEISFDECDDPINGEDAVDGVIVRISKRKKINTNTK